MVQDQSLASEKDYAGEIWNEAQQSAMLALADAAVPAMSEEEIRKMLAELPPDTTEAQRAVAVQYARQKFSDVPGALNILAMHVATAIPEDTRSKLSLFLSVLSTRPGCFVLTGRVGPVQELDKKVISQLLVGWMSSRLQLMRLAASGVVVLSQFVFYTANRTAWEALGYPEGPGTDWQNPPSGTAPPQERVPHYRFRFLNGQLPKTPTDAPLEFTTDVLIIGSGSGGGVTAEYLSRRGVKVMVVDKGLYVPQDEITGSEQQGFERMYDGHGFIPSADGSIFVLAGSGLGGGTAINWSATLKPRHYLREAWARDFGVPYFQSPEFTQDINAVIHYMGASTNHTEHNRSNSLLALGAQRTGQPVVPVPQNTGGQVHYCGKCVIGCACGHKQSGLVSWLKDAAEHGAEFFTECHVDRILMDKNNTAIGALASVQGHRVVLRARRGVVVSAGSLQTPALLMRTPELRPNTQIGKHLRLHPVAFVHGYYDFPVNPWEGAALTTACSSAELTDPNGWGAQVEVIASAPGLHSALIPFEGGVEHKVRALRYRYSYTMLIIVRDRGEGTITLDKNGQPIVNYTPSSFDQRSLVQGMLRGAEIHMAAGASEIATSQTDLPPYVCPPHRKATPDDNPDTHLIPGSFPFERTPAQGDCADPTFRAWQQQLVRAGASPLRIKLGSAHQMGSCRMGADPKQSALDPKGHVRGANNLWVSDASTFPEASGVNPMLTVMSICRGISRNIAQELGVESVQVAPSAPQARAHL